jgi:hypothetical protein
VLAQQDHAPHHKHKHKHKHTHQQNPMQTHTQHTTRPTHHPRPIDAPNENTQTHTHTHTRTHPYGPHTSYHPVMRDQPVHTLLDLTRLDWLRSSFFVRDRTQHTGAPVAALSLFPFLQLLNSSPTIESNRRRTPRRDKRLASKPAKTSTNTHKTEKRKPKACATKQNTAQREGATQRNATQCSAARSLWR